MQREWIACKTAELKEWKKVKSKALWLADGVEQEMPDTLLMSYLCLLELVKRGEEFDEKSKLVTFLLQWPNLNEFLDEIFACLCRSSFHGNSESLFTKVKRKEILKTACVSKKLTNMDDSKHVKASRITALKDQWMINNNKMNLNLKA